MKTDLVRQLRSTVNDACRCGTPVCLEAANRIEELEIYQSIHAQCEKVSLELEAKLVKKLSVAYNHIEKLKAGEEDWNRICNSYAARVDKLETALREISSVSKVMAKSEDMAQALTTLLSSHRKIALAALEGKDD